MEPNVKALGEDLHHLGVEVDPDILKKLVTMGWRKTLTEKVTIKIPQPLPTYAKGNEKLPIVLHLAGGMRYES